MVNKFQLTLSIERYALALSICKLYRKQRQATETRCNIDNVNIAYFSPTRIYLNFLVIKSQARVSNIHSLRK